MMGGAGGNRNLPTRDTKGVYQVEDDLVVGIRVLGGVKQNSSCLHWPGTGLTSGALLIVTLPATKPTPSFLAWSQQPLTCATASAMPSS
jgi:hypothetical protein